MYSEYEVHPSFLYFRAEKSHRMAHDMLFKEETVLTGGDTKVPENEVESVKKALKQDEIESNEWMENCSAYWYSRTDELDDLPSIGPSAYTEKRIRVYSSYKKGKPLRRSLRIAARQKD